MVRAAAKQAPRPERRQVAGWRQRVLGNRTCQYVRNSSRSSALIYSQRLPPQGPAAAASLLNAAEAHTAEAANVLQTAAEPESMMLRESPEAPQHA